MCRPVNVIMWINWQKGWSMFQHIDLSVCQLVKNNVSIHCQTGLSMSMCQCVDLSMSRWQCIDRKVCQCDKMSICQCVKLSMSTCQCINRKVCHCVNMSICQCVDLSMWTCLHIDRKSVSINMSISKCVNMSVCQCIDLSMSTCQWIDWNVCQNQHFNVQICQRVNLAVVAFFLYFIFWRMNPLWICLWLSGHQINFHSAYGFRFGV